MKPWGYFVSWLYLAPRRLASFRLGLSEFAAHCEHDPSKEGDVKQEHQATKSVNPKKKRWRTSPHPIVVENEDERENRQQPQCQIQYCEPIDQVLPPALFEKTYYNRRNETYYKRNECAQHNAVLLFVSHDHLPTTSIR